MKVTLGFLSGVIICGLVLLGLQAAIPIRAQTENTSLTSDNFSLVELLPDIEKIYREALISPFLEAEEKIYDEDIHQFYRKLLERTGLDSVNGTAN